MYKTSKILAALAVLVLAVSVMASNLLAADEEKPKVRHPSYTLLGHNPPPIDSPLNPNFVLSQESKILEGTLWHSSYLNERLVGLDVADATGDGKNELAYATLNNVYLARMSGDTLEQLAVFSVPSTLAVLSLDFYDTNGDGRHEILISCQQKGAGASSYILSYSSGQKELNVQGSFIPWYLRVYGSGGQRLLAVQKSSSSINSAYTGDVYTATISGDKVVTGEKLKLPFGVNLYNFNVGELGASHQRVVATVTFPEEHLRLYAGTTRDDLIAQAADEYCGTLNYILINTSRDTAREVEYLPSRIIFADIDKDGANEVIVAKNKLGGIKIMKNLRSFDGGVIEALKLSNLSLVSFFSSTNMMPGPPVDYQLADLDNNGTKDLVVAVVIAPGSGMIEDGRSVIVSYSNLYTPQQPPAQTSTASK